MSSFSIIKTSEENKNSLTLQPNNNLSSTLVPYGLYINSPFTKTYPTTSDFRSYPAHYTNLEMGTSQTYDTTTGFNFIYADYRNLTKGAGTTSDIERLYFNGISQNFNWVDANTCKQYIGITDNFSYSGIDANGRTSSSFNSNRITLNCPASSTQTISSVKSETMRISSNNNNSITNINTSNSQNLQLLGAATGCSININNHSFLENSSTWNSNLTGAGTLATITNMYGLRLYPPSSTTGLTITNNWGVYSGWSSAQNYFAGNVGIGTTSINSSAILQADSTTKGFLPPRMTAAQANAIGSPVEGLMVYVTDTGGSPFNFIAKGWWGYDGTTWKQLG